MKDKQQPKPVDYDELFPGRFIKAGLFAAKPLTLRLKAIDTEPLPQDDGHDRVRGIISFHGTDKQWVLNSTNGQCLKAMWGKRVQDWIGQSVTLCSEQAPFGLETVDAVRVKGSPSLTEPLDVEIRLPRKKPKIRRLVPTGKAARASAPATPPPPADPDDDYDRSA